MMSRSSFHRLVAAVLLPPYLAACTGWQVQQTAPEQVLADEQPSKVLVTLVSGTEVELRDPRVVGDTLYGSIPGVAPERAIALADVRQLATSRTDAGKTVLLVVGIVGGLMLGSVLLYRATCNENSFTC